MKGTWLTAAANLLSNMCMKAFFLMIETVSKHKSKLALLIQCIIVLWGLALKHAASFVCDSDNLTCYFIYLPPPTVNFFKQRITAGFINKSRSSTRTASVFIT